MAQAQYLASQAASRGVSLLVLPECFGFISPVSGASAEAREPVDKGFLASACSSIAKAHTMWVIAGGMHEDPREDVMGMDYLRGDASGEVAAEQLGGGQTAAAKLAGRQLAQHSTGDPDTCGQAPPCSSVVVPDDKGKCFNSQLVFDPTGTLLAVYRKVHLFDFNQAYPVAAKPHHTTLGKETRHDEEASLAAAARSADSAAGGASLVVESGAASASGSPAGQVSTGASETRSSASQGRSPGGEVTPSAPGPAPGSMPSLGESRFTAPGQAMVAVDAGPMLGRIGLTTCYDVRFPMQFAALRRAGCDLLTVPSAFTVPTGAAHWEVLLRARAIETQCYVLAAAQTGSHASSGDASVPPRVSWGHAMIVSPWGDVVAQAPRHGKPGIAVAEIDLRWLREDLRKRMPLLEHSREDVYCQPVHVISGGLTT